MSTAICFNFILFISCSPFIVIYMNNLSNHPVSIVKQLAADILFIAHNTKTLAGELNSDLKANLNGHVV